MASPTAEACAALLAVLGSCQLLGSLFLHRWRGRHPITDRSPLLVLASNAFLFAATVLLLIGLLCAPSAPQCLLLTLSLCSAMLPSPVLLLLRSLVLLFRLELTAQLQAFAASQEELRLKSPASAERRPLGPGKDARRPSLTAGAMEGTSAAADGGATPEGIWYVDHRWLVGRPFLCCAFGPLLSLALLGGALAALGASESPSCAPQSTTVAAVRAVGLALFAAHAAVLCASAARHPLAHGLRAEAALSAVAAAVLLPLSFALSTTGSPDAAWYVLLSFYCAAFCAPSLLPLYATWAQWRLSTSLAELSRIESFDDLIRNPLGYDSFLAYLRTEFSEENLLFWGQVEQLHGRADDLERLTRTLGERRDRERAATTVVAPGLRDADEERTVRRSTAAGSAKAARSSHSVSEMASSSRSLTPPLGAESPRSQQRRAVPGAGAGPARAEAEAHALQGGTPRRALNAALTPRTPTSRRRRNSAGDVGAGDGAHSLAAAGPPSPFLSTSALSAALQPPPQSSDSLTIPGTAQLSASLLPSSHPRLLSGALSEDGAMVGALLPRSSYASYHTTMDDSWDLEAIDKLRRVSWSIALEKRAQRHRASRSRDAAAAERKRSHAGSIRRSVSPRLSASPRNITPGHLQQTAAPALQVGGGGGGGGGRGSGGGDSSPKSPKAAAPFMQSIVRALQATKLASTKRSAEREDDATRRLTERQAALHAELLRRACDIADRFVVPGSPCQVNLPDALVQRVMDRMREIHPRRYNGTAKARRTGGGGQHGPGSGAMQHTLGLMRHATMNFFAAPHAQKGRVLPSARRFPEREPAERAKERSRQAAAVDDAAMVRDLSALSFPIAALFRDAQDAIRQLMEKDSFKRYLGSAAFEHFCTSYTARRRAGSGWTGPAAPSRQSSRSRLIVVTTPRVSNREAVEDAAPPSVAGAVARRGSDSGAAARPLRHSPRAERSLSLQGDDAARRPSIGALSPSPAPGSRPPHAAVHTLPLPPSPSHGTAGPSWPSPPHALWSDLQKLTLPMTPLNTRAHSGSVLLHSQLSQSRSASTKHQHQQSPQQQQQTAVGSPRTAAQRTLVLQQSDGAGGLALTPRSSRGRRIPSPSVSARGGIREEPDEAEADALERPLSAAALPVSAHP